jgi:hypothetical protein
MPQASPCGVLVCVCWIPDTAVNVVVASVIEGRIAAPPAAVSVGAVDGNEVANGSSDGERIIQDNDSWS